VASVRVRTFEAVDMAQALRRVRDELGPDAVIVGSREVRRGGGPFGLLGRSLLEVTATAPDETAAQAIGAEEAAPAPKPDEAVPWDPATRADLGEIRAMLSALVTTGSVAPDAEGAAAQRLYYGLLARGIDDPLARGIVQRVVARVPAGALGDLERLRAEAAAEMRADLARAARAGLPGHVQLFVGPTGVGKTTTIAKLAARAARATPDGVLVVTTDVQRVAAVEQLARWGEILGLPVEVAVSPDDLSRALARAADRERVFVDTAGRSPRDLGGAAELASLVAAAGDAEVMLVLSATTRAADSRELLELYGKLPVSRLVMTKLDETRIHGELYNAVVRSGRPIACVTTGQSVPDDLASLDVTGILRTVLQD
jgi:flagellar biosynthesis protein FlhF